MTVRTLDWDSRFFGLRIGRADLQTGTDCEELSRRHAEWKQQYDLLYVFDNGAVGFRAAGARLVDKKILYSKPCEPHKPFPNCTFFNGDHPTDALYHLALVSGGFSRFKLDQRLPKGSFEQLYSRWIENACPAEGSNRRILISEDEHGVAQGMITFDYQDALGHIGLVAVNTDRQHSGIGSRLIATVESYLFEQGVKTLEVPTQKANTDACRWYEKNGFTIQNKTPIYHWWL